MAPSQNSRKIEIRSLLLSRWYLSCETLFNTQSHNQESIDIFIRNHRIRVHEGKTVCSCTLCGKSFRGRDGLTYHMSKEAKKELCELCKKEYSSKNAH